jgi:hypothetical protein
MIRKKPALGLDPGGGYRFAEKDHAPTKNLDHDPIQRDRMML